MKASRLLNLAFASAFAMAGVTLVSHARHVSPPEPDLTIERASFDKSKLKATFYLWNKGVAKASTCSVAFRISKAKLGTQQYEVIKVTRNVAPLDPGGRLTIAFDVPKAGEFVFGPIDAKVDSGNQIRESDESNNEWSFLKVGGSVKAPSPTP